MYEARPDPGHAGWDRLPVPVGLLRPPAVLVRGQGQTSRGKVFLPAAPQLATQDGAPGLSLTLVLGRQPEPDEPDIAPLIRLGLLSLQVTLAVPPAVAATLPDPGSMQPLFAREARFDLIDGPTGAVLATSTAVGPAASGTLGATLGRDATLAVLDAVDGATTGLRVSASIAPSGSILPAAGSTSSTPSRRRRGRTASSRRRTSRLSSTAWSPTA